MNERFSRGSMDGGTPQKSERQIKRRPAVAPEIRRAGELFEKALTTHGVSVLELAESSSMSDGYWRNFAKGKVPNPSKDIILEGIDNYIDPEDERVCEIRNIFERREGERDWLRLFTGEGSSLEKSIRYVRLSSGLSKAQFAKNLRVSIHTFDEVETGHRGISLFTANTILAHSPLSSLGEVSKPAQALRLQVAGMEIMKAADFIEASIPEVMEYIAILHGIPKQSLSKQLFGYSTTLAEIKSGKISLHQSNIEKFIHLSALSPEDPLAKMISHGPESNNPITLSDIFLGPYLFQEFLEELPNQEITDETKDSLCSLQKISFTGGRLRFLREKAGKLQKDLGVRKQVISQRESNSKTPDDAIIVQTLGLIDPSYTIHHPLTQFVLNEAEKERQQRLASGVIKQVQR